MFQKTEIPLTQNKIALIDKEKFDLVSQFKWHARKDRHIFYASTNTKNCNGTRLYLSMHRLIMQPPNDLQIDHINGDGLDNRLENLRIVYKAQNLFNQRKRAKNTSSQYKGVYLHKKKQKWQAQIQHNKKVIYLGYFHKEKDAARAYDMKARELFGEYACLNFKGN